ncbi:MAG: helix-turn-helix domain-containing protein [Nanoarchaeota archaeon]
MKNIEVLMGCGFNLYESKVLLSLHKLKDPTAKEVCQDSEVPKNKVYEVLEGLIRGQIVRILPAQPKRYCVINLKGVLQERLAKRSSDIQALEGQLDSAIGVPQKSASYDETFWVMEGESAMINKIIETLADVHNESIGLIDVWAIRPANLRAVRDAISRGVKFYFLGTIDKKSRPIAREYAKLGVEVRHYPVHGAGYSIFDGRKVQLRVTEKKIVSLWVESEQFADMLRKNFFQLWSKGRKISL